MTKNHAARLPERLFLGYHTLKRMQPEQVAGIGVRKSRELLIPRLPIDTDSLYDSRVPEDPPAKTAPVGENTATLRQCLDESTRERYRTRVRQAADGAPRFMNQTLRIADGTDVYWEDDRFEELPLLWALKLYAFQPLSWLCAGFDPGDEGTKELQSTFDGWILDWTENAEIGRPRYLRRTWTPWAVSLRILHWCRYLAWRQTGDGVENGTFERLFREEIYKNALFLDNHIEWDVGGNHLVENGAALVVAGVLFDNDPWVDTGTRVLNTAAITQFLDDGCHFERSPMYHVLTLTRYLTACDTLTRDGLPVPDTLRTTIRDATAFLQYLRPPDGRMPLLNDAVYGQALSLDECLQYADTLGFGNPSHVKHSDITLDVRDSDRTSGYRWLRNAAGAVLIDGGPVGPPHLPGHSHSDTLSFLLWFDDQQIVTDTGTRGYVGDSDRKYARGVRGHNTVQVGDIEPISIGGKYLMGPRPVPTTRFTTGDVSLFEGRYDARPYDGNTYSHHRAVFAGDRWWLVWDTVSGHGGVSTTSRLHLHPRLEAFIQASGRIRLDTGGANGFLHPIGTNRTGIAPGPYFPLFGTVTERSVVELHGERGTDPARLGFFLTRDDLEGVSVEFNDKIGVPKKLYASGDEYRLPETRLVRK